ncbi:7961_t:CDS:2 [Ambispora gerdemannii]|uniref:7961_t:CDS:1 n=1 Tax=Ambispora gerdemannii TaxID=144530 RepID=A0A9N8V7C4_9GLOM|nr:7961_t:CDS:2 [Ambispora gerdemannii]
MAKNITSNFECSTNINNDIKTNSIHPCACDFRVEIFNCPEANYLHNLYIASIIGCALVLISLIPLLIYRTKCKNGKFERNFNARGGGSIGRQHNKKYSPRFSNLVLSGIANNKPVFQPRPVETYYLIHIAARLVTSTMIVKDILPQFAWKEFLNEFPWTFGYMGIGMYLIGIMYVDVETQQLVLAPKRSISHHYHTLTPEKLDIFGWLIVIVPFTTLNILAILSGVFRDYGHRTLADILVKIHYAWWALLCFLMAAGLFYFGNRLLTILRGQLKEFTGPGCVAGALSKMQLEEIRRRLLKLKVILSCMIATMLFFTISLFIFAFFREYTLIHASKFLSFTWILLSPFMILITVIAIAINTIKDETTSSTINYFSLYVPSWPPSSPLPIISESSNVNPNPNYNPSWASPPMMHGFDWPSPQPQITNNLEASPSSNQSITSSNTNNFTNNNHHNNYPRRKNSAWYRDGGFYRSITMSILSSFGTQPLASQSQQSAIGIADSHGRKSSAGIPLL